MSDRTLHALHQRLSQRGSLVQTHCQWRSCSTDSTDSTVSFSGVCTSPSSCLGRPGRLHSLDSLLSLSHPELLSSRTIHIENSEDGSETGCKILQIDCMSQEQPHRSRFEAKLWNINLAIWSPAVWSQEATDCSHHPPLPRSSPNLVRLSLLAHRSDA
jgi:hypothetical protein